MHDGRVRLGSGGQEAGFVFVNCVGWRRPGCVPALGLALALGDMTGVRAMFGSRREVMPAHGRVLVIDAVIPPGNDPHPAKLVDLIMLTALTGRERTEPEFRELLAAAGFRLTRVIATPSALSIVEGMPA